MDHLTYEVFKDKGSKWRYRVKNSEGKIVLSSPIKDSWDTAEEVQQVVQGLRGLLGAAQIKVVG